LRTITVSILIQQRVPADQHGRVFGVQTAVFYAAPSIGMVIVGISVERIGVETTYLILASIISAAALLTLLIRSSREEF
jgi:predicted MFS family arabinose efflux permease